MTSKKIDWHLTVAIIGVFVGFVAAIPSLYSFEKQKFVWQTTPAVTPPVIIYPKPDGEL